MKEFLQRKLGTRVTVATILSVCGFMLIMDVWVVFTPGMSPRTYLGVIFAAAYAGWFLNDAVSMMRARKPVDS